MNKLLLASAAVVALAVAGFAQARTVVPAGHFDSVELEGGGHVVLKHGDTQRVTMLKGSTQFTRIAIEDGNKLKIEACNSGCPHEYDLEIVIETPEIVAVAIDGGGHIESSGSFPDQHQVTAAIEGGGHIDLSSIDAANATAAVNGGGHIALRAEKKLTAAINGGGHITYQGNPEVTEAVDGGGSVSRGD